jgi:L-lactate dehydrogenase complex protein LldE
MGDMRVSLFVTCLVDQLFPRVGESVVRLLRRLGVEVDFPEGQTCCGQPAFNSGFRREARALARSFLTTFRDSRYIVVPSGSCTSMIRNFYPSLFPNDPELRQEAQGLRERVYELSEFLVRVLGVSDTGASFSGRVAYHPSCHLLRELGVSEEPLALLRGVRGIELVGLENAEVCCGFGGAFSVKYPHISEAMLEEKVRCVARSGAQVLVACDMGCLMHIAGGLSRRGVDIRAMHLAELLAQEG